MLHSSVVLEKTEQALVASAKAGDEAAFRDLIEPLSRATGLTRDAPVAVARASASIDSMDLNMTGQ